MKKRLLALLLTLTLALSCLIGMNARTEAASLNGETVYFTVINDTLIDLDYYSMPALLNGRIYVPYMLFNTYFKITVSYSAPDRILFLSANSKIVKFDIDAGVAYDRNGNIIRQTALLHRGQVFVPADFVAGYFELSYYLLSSANIVRFTDGNAYYPDAFLPSQFAAEMESMLASAATATTTTSTVATQTTTAASTAPPATTVPADTTTAVTTTVPDTTKATEVTTMTAATVTTAQTTVATTARQSFCSFCFLLEDVEGLSELLELLEREELVVCFLTEGTLPDAEAAVLAAGHCLGIYLEAVHTPSQALETAERVNDLLYRAVRCKVRLCGGNISSACGAALEEAGYGLLSDLTLTDTSAEGLSSCLDKLPDAVTLTLRSCSAEGFRELLTALNQVGALPTDFTLPLPNAVD